jgi:hypothetical protein
LNCKLHTRRLVREGALYEEARKCWTKENLKFGHGPQMWARHQDELEDWTSVTKSTSNFEEVCIS